MDVMEKPSSKKRLIDANAGNTAHGMRKKVLTMTPDIWRMLFFVSLGIVFGNLFERWRFK